MSKATGTIVLIVMVVLAFIGCIVMPALAQFLLSKGV